jgi:Na+-driven multidrug efflux pump
MLPYDSPTLFLQDDENEQLEYTLQDVSHDIETGSIDSNDTQVSVEAVDVINLAKTIFELTFSLTLTDTFAFRNICFPFLSTQVDNSPQNTAAIALIIPVVSTMIMGVSVLFSLNLTGSKLVAELEKLEKNTDAWNAKRLEIVDLYRCGLIISTIIAPICMLVMIESGPLLHQVLQQDKEVSYLAQDFLRPYSAVVPPVFLWMCALQMTSSFKYTKSTPIGPISFGLGLFLAIGLGLGLMGMPKWGTMGIFTGYGFEAYLTAAAYTYIIFFAQDFKDIQFKALFSNVHNIWPKVQNQMLDGSAIAITVISELLLVFYLSILSGFIGTQAQEALALAIQYIVANDVLIVNAAVSSAMVLGSAIGSKNHQDVFSATRYGVITSALICSPIPILCAAYPQGLMTIFNNQDKEVALLLKQLAPYISTGLILNAISYVCIIQARVLGDRWNSTYERVGSLVLGMILSGALLKFTDLKIQSIGLGYFVSMLLSTTSLWLRCTTMQEKYCQDNEIAPSQKVIPHVSNILSRIGFHALASSRVNNNEREISHIEITPALGG